MPRWELARHQLEGAEVRPCGLEPFFRLSQFSHLSNDGIMLSATREMSITCSLCEGREPAPGWIGSSPHCRGPCAMPYGHSSLPVILETCPSSGSQFLQSRRAVRAEIFEAPGSGRPPFERWLHGVTFYPFPRRVCTALLQGAKLKQPQADLSAIFCLRLAAACVEALDSVGHSTSHNPTSATELAA